MRAVMKTKYWRPANKQRHMLQPTGAFEGGGAWVAGFATGAATGAFSSMAGLSLIDETFFSKAKNQEGSCAKVLVNGSVRSLLCFRPLGLGLEPREAAPVFAESSVDLRFMLVDW
jgi:hypothetical protein